MSKVVKNYCEFPSALRRPMWQIWHKLIIRFDKNVSANFMNYGYQSLNGDKPLILEKQDENNRYGIQLYDHVVKDARIQGKKVLEIGSGRGGGASYITRYYKPANYTAVDISAQIIDFCNKHYQEPNLSFVKGRAERLPIESQSVDVVVNIESARCYSDLSLFFNEVKRVLRPDGHFMFADMVEDNEVEELKQNLHKSGFKILKHNDITDNIVKALDIDTQRRQKLIDRHVPKFLRNSFYQFAGTKGSERYNAFKTRKFRYCSFALAPQNGSTAE